MRLNQSRSRSFLLAAFFFVLFFAPSALFAQVAKELPCKTAEEAKVRLDKARAEIEQLRAELASLQALAPAEPETFLIP